MGKDTGNMDGVKKKKKPVCSRNEPQWMVGDMKDGWCVWMESSMDEPVVGGDRKSL